MNNLKKLLAIIISVSLLNTAVASTQSNVEDIKRSFSKFSSMKKENINVQIAEVTRDLINKNIGLDELIEFASLDMNSAQKKNFMEQVEILEGSSLADFSEAELQMIMGTLVEAQSTGSHWISCHDDLENFLVGAAIATTVLALVIIPQSMTEVEWAEGELEKEKAKAQPDSGKIKELKEERDSNKGHINMGIGMLAVGAASAFGAYSCN